MVLAMKDAGLDTLELVIPAGLKMLNSALIAVSGQLDLVLLVIASNLMMWLKSDAN